MIVELIDALYLYNFESVRGLGFLTGKRVLFFLSRLVSVRFESFESAPFIREIIESVILII